VIGKITAPRGTRLAPLVYYLYGPGRREEHTDPHLVAGWRHPAELEPPLHADGTRDFRDLLGLLAQPHAAMGAFAAARPVWHCSLRTAPGDKTLSDAEWAQIAQDVMHRTSLSRRGSEDEGVRWAAVRHAGDHIHLVAVLARQDFRRPRLHNERCRVREACLAAEARYGLRPTAPGDRTAARCPTRAENEKAARRGLGEPPRVTLRRAVTTAAACAASEQEFFTQLEAAGVLSRKRLSTRYPGQVTGYAVALPGDTCRDGGPVWYGGGKLAPDLTWPKLRHHWAAPSPAAAARYSTGRSTAARFTAQERNAIWDHAGRAAADAAARIRVRAATNPAAAADAAWAASATLHAAAAALGSRVLRQAADSFDRAARAPYARIPRPSPAGDRLRRAAWLLGTLTHATTGPDPAPLILLTRLAALAEAVAELRAAQQRAAQAAAARASAECLYAVGAARTRPSAATQARTAAHLAGLSFPASTPPGGPPAGPYQARPGPAHGPSPPRRSRGR
jgi:hypothetical protein